MQLSDAVWISIFMSACSGIIAIGLMLVTFYFIRRHRLRSFPRGLGYTLLHGGEAGMTPAELRALPVRCSSAGFSHGQGW